MPMWDHRSLWPHLAVALACCCSLASAFKHRDNSALESSAFLRSRRSTSWNYQDGGSSWSNEGQCGGDAQSPVNVSGTVAIQPTDGENLYYAYPRYEAPVKMKNNGQWLFADIDSDIKSDGSSAGVIALGAFFPSALTVTWDLYRIVVHTPSEHTFMGVHVPLELQLFHRQRGSSNQADPAPTETAVVAIGFTDSDTSVDEPSPFLEALRQGGLPKKRGEEKLVNRAYPSSLNFDELYRPVLPAHDEKAIFWEYSGSLTSPPCSQGVRWFLRHEPLPGKTQTFEEFKDAAEAASSLPMEVFSNARALQPLGERAVVQRFPEGAIGTVSKKKTDAARSAFDSTIARALEYQKEFQEGLAAAEAKKAGGTSQAEIGDQHANCIQELGEIISKLTSAEAQQKIECDRAAELQSSFDESGAGVTRTEAAMKLATQKDLCAQEGDVVTALQGEKEKTQATCDEMNQEAQTAAPSETPATGDTTASS